MQTKLADILDFFMNYIKDKQNDTEFVNTILSDCLFRYIHLIESNNNNPKEKLIDCIKKYNKLNLNNLSNSLPSTYSLTETNKLLLTKCLYYQHTYEQSLNHQNQN